jgi:hypothetical protein
MMTRLNLSSMPTRGDIDAVVARVQASAAELRIAAEKTPSRGAASASDETFAEKVKEAVKRKLGSQHKDRYRKPRKQTKGE